MEVVELVVEVEEEIEEAGVAKAARHLLLGAERERRREERRVSGAEQRRGVRAVRASGGGPLT